MSLAVLHSRKRGWPEQGNRERKVQANFRERLGDHLIGMEGSLAQPRG